MFWKNANIDIPADVPRRAEKEFAKNYIEITQKTGRLMLFACDQKIEHLNNDFYGPHIHKDALYPEHFFRIATHGFIGAFATHLGLIARYGKHYPGLPYIVKLNGKTNLVPISEHDPVSSKLWSVSDVIQLKNNTGISIRGVGYTIYLGSHHEHIMLKEAAHIVNQAHEHGLITILWIYARGKSIKDDHDANLAAGAAGVAASLGADFVKIKPPRAQNEKTSAQWLQIATSAAGNTKVICSGGSQKEPLSFLQALYDQIHIGGTAGNATGRNIFQRSFENAVAFTKAISALVHNNQSVETAFKIYENTLTQQK